MAIVRVEPIEIRVRTDWFDGVPRKITWREETLNVTGLAAVRLEDQAYRAEVGPRTVFEVDTPKGRLSLGYEHWSRRWTLDGVDETVRLS